MKRENQAATPADLSIGPNSFAGCDVRDIQPDRICGILRGNFPPTFQGLNFNIQIWRESMPVGPASTRRLAMRITSSSAQLNGQQVNLGMDCGPSVADSSG